MTDNYQATYDAVRSRITNCDVGYIVEREFFNATQNMADAFRIKLSELQLYEMWQPSAIYRPKLSIDGDMWCALYGENLQDGLAGFGKSPQEAMNDFNIKCSKKLP